MTQNEYFTYPDKIKPDFIETDDLVFRDGKTISTEEIWHFMTEDGPTRFPHAFSISQYYTGRLSNDTEFLSSIKRSYLYLTAKDRLLDAHKKGVPVVLVQGVKTWIHIMLLEEYLSDRDS